MSSGLDYEDLYNIVLVSNPVYGPMGRRIAFHVSRLNKEKNRIETSIWIADESGASPLTRGPSDRCPVWGPEGDKIAFARKLEEEKGTSIMVIRSSGGEAWRLSTHKLGATPIAWSRELQGIVASIRVSREGVDKWKPYGERDVLTAEGTLPLYSNGSGWVFDRYTRIAVIGYPDGRITWVSPEARRVASIGVHSETGRIAYSYIPDPRRPFEQVLVLWEKGRGERTLLEGYSIAGIAWDIDGDRIAFRARSPGTNPVYTHYRVYVLDVDEPEPQCVSCDLDRNTIPAVNSDARGPSCSRGLEWGPDGLVYFPVHDAGSVKLYRGLPDTGVEPVVQTGNGVVDEFTVSEAPPVRIAYTFMTATSPSELFIWSEEGGVERLTWFNDWVEERVSKPRKYTVEGSNGDPLDFWILLPPGKRGGSGKTPWVLYIHGGPKTSYGYGFMFEFHLLASKGYAIVYGNPHGSDGYSEDYADLSKGRLGNYDYNDLMIIADTAPIVEQSLDEERYAVAGGSYGGWMTNYIITRTSRFKAAITQRSCSNWASFWGASDIGWYFAEFFLSAGPPWEDPEAYTAYSPLYRADRISTPTLVIHALEDYRCPLDQALQLYTALTVRGVPSRIALFPGENHDLSRSGSPRRRIARLREIVGWLDKFLGREGLNKPGGDSG